MIILLILGILLLFILLIILALIFIPFDYCCHGEKYESAYMLTRISWLWGGLRFEYRVSPGSSEGYISVLGAKIAMKPGRRHKEKKEKSRGKEKGKRVNYLRIDFIERLIKAINELLSHVKPGRFEVNGSFGFDEPYDTSVLWLCILALPLHYKNSNINLTPIFYDEVLEGKFIIEGRIVLVVLLWIAVKLRFSRPVKNILKERKKKVYVT